MLVGRGGIDLVTVGLGLGSGSGLGLGLGLGFSIYRRLKLRGFEAPLCRPDTVRRRRLPPPVCWHRLLPVPLQPPLLRLDEKHAHLRHLSLRLCDGGG